MLGKHQCCKGKPLTNIDVTIRVLTWTSSMGQLQKMLSTWPKSCMVMYRPLSQRKPSRMYRNVVQQTVTYVDMLRSKPSRMYRHVIKLTVTSHRHVCIDVSYSKPSRIYRHVTQQTVTHVQKCHKANRHVSSQTITYVQKCHTANHDVCVDVSHSKPSRMFKRVIQQTATSQRQLLRMNRHVIVTH